MNLQRSAPAVSAAPATPEIPAPPETIADDAAAARPRLRHVLWLGGSACSGKSEVARRLAAAHGVAVYAADDSFERHRKLADPRSHAAFCRVGDLAPEELWAAPAARQAEELLAFHGEHLEMVVGDLVRTDAAAPLLAEGACLLPARVAELASRPSQALWLVATPDFRRRLYRRRGAWVDELLGGCSEPGEVFERWMERDDALASWRVAEAARLGLACWIVDGSQGPDALAAAAAAHFGLAGCAAGARREG